MSRSRVFLSPRRVFQGLPARIISVALLICALTTATNLLAEDHGDRMDSGSGDATTTTSPSGDSSSSTTSISGDSTSSADTSSASGANSLSTPSTSSTPSAQYDGPAQLPLVYMQTALANTPAPGKKTTVAAGADLQAALNAAACGDTLMLQAGATFSGVYTFPNKGCDNAHWIIVRTASADSTLPPEGTRLTPCYAGVSSLPGRPALNCKSTANVVAKISVNKTGISGPIIFATGAAHYRLLGLEITRQTGGGIVYALASLANSATASNVIFDRVWMHGTAQDETQKGVSLGGSSNFAVVDSYLNDFHCISKTGTCTDGIAITGGNGDLAMGPYKFNDNFLEASSENILFGGSEATKTPADIEIRYNHFFKPLTWLKGQKGYVGGSNGNPFVVKNLFELKNAQRVLFEGNILEYTWGGFSQAGYGILLTPKNQSNGGSNVCPLCQVTDITIRYSTISHVASGFQVANGLSDSGGAPLAGERYSIHDVVVDDVNPTLYIGVGVLAQVSMGIGVPLLQQVDFNHITAFAPQIMLNVGDFTSSEPKIANFTFNNSIVSAGVSPVWSTGGGSSNCAYYDKPLTTFAACMNPYSFVDNAVIAPGSNFPPSVWPVGNWFPANTAAVGFTSYNNGNGGNYQLLSSSPYKNAGTDGKDLGADIVTINSLTKNVR
ncbi:MAG TPA: hypothetical protein VJQ82_09965 [Terriglobales bacterium]|nr:hypothetical protein [Terriglobales bacterium]